MLEASKEQNCVEEPSVKRERHQTDRHTQTQTQTQTHTDTDTDTDTDTHRHRHRHTHIHTHTHEHTHTKHTFEHKQKHRKRVISFDATKRKSDTRLHVRRPTRRAQLAVVEGAASDRLVLRTRWCLKNHCHVTSHMSQVTRHTSHVTHHTSHITRHTSHITRLQNHCSVRRHHQVKRGRGSHAVHKHIQGALRRVNNKSVLLAAVQCLRIERRNGRRKVVQGFDVFG